MTAHPATPLGRAARLATTLIFLTAISLPVCGNLFFPRTNRGAGEVLAPLPAWEGTAASLAARIQALRQGGLEKRFGFRGPLIRLDNLIAVHVFSSAPFSPVAVGKSGWLFLAKDKDRDLLEERRERSPLPPEQLAAITAEFSSRRDWLAGLGTGYLLVVVPDKATIYPEYLPSPHDIQPPSQRLDQAIDALRGAGIDVCDEREALRSAKRDKTVFYRTDTHWNTHGAYAAYLSLLSRLAELYPGLEQSRFDAYSVQTRPFAGDLGKLLGIEDSLHEELILYEPKFPLASSLTYSYRFSPHYSMPAWKSERPGAAYPRVVVLHDSYYIPQYFFFVDHFRSGVYAWVKPPDPGRPRFFDKELIEQEKPDLVIEEIAERYLLNPLPPPGQP